MQLLIEDLFVITRLHIEMATTTQQILKCKERRRLAKFAFN